MRTRNVRPGAGDEARTRDPYLGKVGSNSEYERTGKRSRDAYFPAGSMLFDAELTAVEVKPRRPVGDRVRAHSCELGDVTWRRATALNLGCPVSALLRRLRSQSPRFTTSPLPALELIALPVSPL